MPKRRRNSLRTSSNHLVYVTTIPMTLDVLMRGHLAFMRGAGFTVTAIASPGEALDRVREREGVNVRPVRLGRDMSPLKDLVSVFRMVKELRLLRPDVVNAGTPKAGLVAMIAGWLSGVPVRIYTVRGLRSETLTGARRFVVGLAERVASFCATEVLCVSESLREVYVEAGYARAAKVAVIGAGSSNGIEVSRFTCSDERRQQTRASLGLSPTDPVVGFVGRIVRDKGIRELVSAFDRVRQTVPNCALVIVGSEETEDPIDDETRERLARGDGITSVGFVDDPAMIYCAFDVFAFPSYREGLPNAVLESAAAGVPCVGFDATGTRDVVQVGRTGLLVEVGDWEGLAEGILAYLADPQLRAEHGGNAHRRVAEAFGREQIWAQLADRYRLLLASDTR